MNRHLYVHPDARKRGVGRRVVAAIETHAMGKFAKLQLYTSSRNAAAFYEKLGYAVVDDGTVKVSHSKVLIS